MERQQILAWERQREEEQRWWESLSPAEREEVERRKEQERQLAEARKADEQRKSEEVAAAHRGRVDAYEAVHGGRNRLEATARRLEDGLRDNPAVDHSFSMVGGLLVAMFFALVPGLFLNAVFQSSGGGIVVAELGTISFFAFWALRRREREQIRRKLLGEQEDTERRMGCGNVECSECYPNQHFRSKWIEARRKIGQDSGCAVAYCKGCYPA
jgi:hypothetical protein